MENEINRQLKFIRQLECVLIKQSRITCIVKNQRMPGKKKENTDEIKRSTLTLFWEGLLGY